MVTLLKTSNTEGSIQKFSEIESDSLKQILTGCEEFDSRISAGGGFVAGSVILLGGEPGVGKTTLLLQLLIKMGLMNRKVLYNSAEESKLQLRGTTLRIMEGNPDTGECYVGNVGDINRLSDLVRGLLPEVIVLDSIQCLYDSECPQKGDIRQQTECCKKAIHLAKELNIPIILIGQLDKQGKFRGGNDLAHNVDVCAYLKHSKTSAAEKILFIKKNRFGPIGEFIFSWGAGRYLFGTEAKQKKVEEAKKVVDRMKGKSIDFSEREKPEQINTLTLIADEYIRLAKGRVNPQALLSILDSLDHSGETVNVILQENDNELFGLTKRAMNQLLTWFEDSQAISVFTREPLAVRF